LVYIDDIVVYAHTYDELKILIEEVFIRLCEANLKLKPTKVKLFQREIQFLGHRISGKGDAMNPDKIAEIVRWHRLKAMHEIRQFLGLCRYYRCYVKDYVQVPTPLHEMVKLVEPFTWTAKRDAAYESFKNILAMSQDVGAYTLDIDASNWAAGAVFQQKQVGLLRVIGYASKAFTGAENATA